MSVEVSVVVPTYRRSRLLARCLAALREQELPPDRFEIIVADDGGDEATRSVVEESLRAGGANCRYLAVSGRHGPAAARNLGWRAARSAVVAFTDDDCLPQPGWLKAGLEAMTEGVDAVSGRIVMPLRKRPTDYERDASGLTTGEFVTANCFCRKSALELVGGFDERFTSAWREDSDLQFSLLARGAAIVRAEAAVVLHPVRPAGWGISLFQQRKTQFNALLFKKHPELYRSRLAPFPRAYLLVNAALGAAIVATPALSRGTIAAAWAIWAALTAQLCLERLRGTSRAPAHVLEMIVTSALVPPLSLFWHVRGLCRFRTFFV